MFATGLGAALFQKQRALSAVMPICVVLDLRTSPIDSPPGQSPEANLALEELSLSIHPEDSAFGFDDWNRIATYTDQYIRLAGDLFQAAHAYTARWRLGRAPATLPPSGLAQFEGISPPNFTNAHYNWIPLACPHAATWCQRGYPSPPIPTLTTIPKNPMPSYGGKPERDVC